MPTMGPGLGGAEARFSIPGGGVGQLTPRGRPCVRLYAPAPKPGGNLSAAGCISGVHFCRSFTAMTAMTQALQFAFYEQDDVATMRRHMVNIRRWCSETMPGAFPAEGLMDQLVGAAFRPVVSGIRVQVMPGSGFPADRLGFMRRAPAFGSDHPAARVFALSQRFQHVVLLPGKRKSQDRQPTAFGRLSALALKALALTYIDDPFPFASAAVDLESGCHRFFAHPDQFRHSAARAYQVPACCWQYYSTLFTIYHMRISPLRINNIKDSS